MLCLFRLLYILFLLLFKLEIRNILNYFFDGIHRISNFILALGLHDLLHTLGNLLL